ncbi:hypothetical protein KAR91_10565 [Candidatus Pacearchaeota archaeon]|nr:hypothetical protein [Candidatus Pacearchaeota archaeon]
MSISMMVENTVYDGFEDVTIVRDLETISGEFSIKTSIRNPKEYPFKAGQPCEVFVNGVCVVNGFIEEVEGITTAQQHFIWVAGRDKTADVIDSDIFDNITIPSSITLVDLIKLTLSKGNIPDIDVIDNVGDIEPFTKDDQVSAEMGGNLFAFIEKYCRKRQVICTTDGNGNISLERASTDEIGRYIISNTGQLENQNNNILSINFGLGQSGRFNQVVVQAQGDPLLSELGLKGDNLVNVLGRATDDEIRTSRTKVILSQTPLTIEVANPMADWHVQVEKGRGVITDLTVQGFSYDASDPSQIWRPNRLINIQDEFWDIKAQMLIKTVTYTLSAEGGSVTSLDLTNRNAYQLSAQEDEIFKKNEDIGTSFLSL